MGRVAAAMELVRMAELVGHLGRVGERGREVGLAAHRGLSTRPLAPQCSRSLADTPQGTQYLSPRCTSGYQRSPSPAL